jgi:enamine deaminase RidA (YjgF/YER057c/UK114 family)
MKNNPFPKDDVDRYAIWDMLVDRDIKAFLAADWEMVADDFIEENFMGVDAGKLGNPDAWRLGCPNLEAYKNLWLEQARIFIATEWGEDIEAALFRVTVLRDIEIRGDSALIHKKFFGSIAKADGSTELAEWQTLYRCRKVGGRWKIAGFTGYMPHLLAKEAPPSEAPIRVPEGAGQHKTAGPYSPVLIIESRKLVVISGQAAIDFEGKVVGTTIEEQTAHTMDNCARQLATAGCSFDDVFKVNVFLTNLDDWPRFNEVYKTYFKDPLPVRAAVQTGLLMTLRVEIEMWAAQS